MARTLGLAGEYPTILLRIGYGEQQAYSSRPIKRRYYRGLSALTDLIIYQWELNFQFDKDNKCVVMGFSKEYVAGLRWLFVVEGEGSLFTIIE